MYMTIIINVIMPYCVYLLYFNFMKTEGVRLFKVVLK